MDSEMQQTQDVDMPCSCPLSGCNYVVSSKTPDRHWSSIHKDSRIGFVFEEETQFKLKPEEQVFYFQEEKDETLFVLHNKVGLHGNTLGLICLGSPDGTRYEFEFTASVPDSGDSMYVRSSRVKNLQNIQSIKPLILITPEFFPNSGRLESRLLVRRR